MASDRMFRNLAIPAVRYALGRRTYIVEDVTEAIEYHRDLLTPEERAIICRDINEAEAAGGLGNGGIDAPKWRHLRDALASQPASADPEPKPGDEDYEAWVDAARHAGAARPAPADPEPEGEPR